MESSLLILDLMRAFYWFDEQLRARLAVRGWKGITRSQSLVLANVANGITRPSHIATNLGVSRQAMSQLLSEMTVAGLVETVPDPDDRRAQQVVFSSSGGEIREAASSILRDLERELADAAGTRAMAGLRTVLKVLPQAE
ncbi:helix-turn-helix domain-containing protein [Novosphingobium sp.]|uniref:MarR family winged helix-turn-helix transcriptional regulator n=1 Tax=Novosphingobium sp. TaxID=1874826 RepID=UPI001EC61BD6|nr:helix-turn-helix domain-containing protein [Novosphingobium sp.]MBK6802045.1 MarR family transcriptional regulator [Novosphingobium sp.]MBK9009344.1 MarR family transcriptional regulator [Novosphingobium sp.]